MFTAQPKAFFYCRDAVCEFVFRNGSIPVNPFRLFEYFLGDRIRRDIIRRAGANLLRRCDQLWVFGRTVAENMLADILLARRLRKPMRLFSIDSHAAAIEEITANHIDFEEAVYAHTGMGRERLIRKLFGRVTAMKSLTFKAA